MSEKYDPIPETVSEALAKWDAGESVFSVEMGGLGPGYEQAIQILAFELMRAFGSVEIADGLSEDEWQILWEGELKRIRDATTDALNAKYGYSGAQVGAATNLALCVIRQGYRAALRNEAVKDRLIQVSQEFPR